MRIAVLQVICAENQSISPGASRCSVESKSAPMVRDSNAFSAISEVDSFVRLLRAGPCVEEKLIQNHNLHHLLHTHTWGCVLVTHRPFCCSLTRTQSPRGPTWSGRTPARPPAHRPLPPCAHRPPPSAPCRPPARTCAPAAAWRSWTDIC